MKRRSRLAPKEASHPPRCSAVQRRCLAPARALEQLGVGCSVFGNLHDADPVHVSRHLQKLNADIVVIGKISGRERLQLARAAKHLGCYVVADISVEEKDSEALHQLMQVVDYAVAATQRTGRARSKKKHRWRGDDYSRLRGQKQATHSPDRDRPKLWMDCFMRVKLKRFPAGANTNVPGGIGAAS